MKALDWKSLFMAMLFGFAALGSAHADDYTKTIDIFKQADTARPFLKSAYGYAVFPFVGKGGFVVGGAYGKGQVYVKDAVTGTTKMVKASVGLQAGGQALSEIIFFQDKRAYDEFTSGSFEFDAGVSAVAITAGAHAKAGTGGATAGVSAGPATGKHAPAQ